jgi:hypothetical protein
VARQETVTLTDDIDGGKAHETVTFGLDGAGYEIDLHSKKAAALRKSLEEFVSAARPIRSSNRFTEPTRRGRPMGSRTKGEPTAGAIREWAASAGVTVSDRGRISAALREQYLEAQQAS